MRIDAQTTDRVAVQEVIAGTPADAAGILAGDTITSVADKPVATFETFRSVLRGLEGGNTTQVEVLRQGVKRTLEVQLAELREQVAGSTVRYGSVDVPKGYRLRTIVTVPENASRSREGRYPGFLYVQGMICDSMDRPDAIDEVDTRLVHTMAGQGFVTMRVDKPGLGDSEGPPCSEIGFQEELEGYLAALDNLARQPEVDPSRIYVFGHSMGGVMAPFLAKEKKVRGSIVYGTIARTWFEHQLENVRRQSEAAGVSPAEVAEALQQQAMESSMILIEKKTLGDVWKRWPELRRESQGTMLDENHMSTRHMRFFHELQDINIAHAWSESDGSVLALWGEYDWVCSRDDHDRIVATVNARQPDAATVLTMPKADHTFTTHTSLNASRLAMGQGRWDENLPKRILEWIDALESGKRVAWSESSVQEEESKNESGLPQWTKLTTEAYPGKQDDIFFIDSKIGFYGNGAGKIFRTTDGGETWHKVFEKKGTFVRCLAFTDD
ncbi:MAG: alpha/beta fold hydrolase, partial [Planctomycetota bacterium]|nr:alpha/beta fold hydrolase [Planctomycetota bacterium]